MRDRVHRCLDGELPRSELNSEELEELRGFEAGMELFTSDGARFEDTDLAPRVLARIRAGARAPSAASADRVRDEGASLASRIIRWLVAPRDVSLHLRPAYGFAVVALLGAAAWLAPLQRVATPTDVAAAGATTPSVFVRFELDAPGANAVRLAGSFSGWKPDIELRRVAGSRWMAMVPLPPGVHDYAFQVDGERWTTDPSAPRVADGFGGYNSRLSIVLADS